MCNHLRLIIPVILFAVTGCSGQFQQVLINSDPPSAYVFVDGSIIGKTPVSVSFDKDDESVCIKLEKEGYLPADRIVRKDFHWSWDCIMWWPWVPMFYDYNTYLYPDEISLQLSSEPVQCKSCNKKSRPGLFCSSCGKPLPGRQHTIRIIKEIVTQRKKEGASRGVEYETSESLAKAITARLVVSSYKGNWLSGFIVHDNGHIIMTSVPRGAPDKLHMNVPTQTDEGISQGEIEAEIVRRSVTGVSILSGDPGNQSLVRVRLTAPFRNPLMEPVVVSRHDKSGKVHLQEGVLTKDTVILKDSKATVSSGQFVWTRSGELIGFIQFPVINGGKIDYFDELLEAAPDKTSVKGKPDKKPPGGPGK